MKYTDLTSQFGVLSNDAIPIFVGPIQGFNY
jgi:hypothetical protein